MDACNQHRCNKRIRLHVYKCIWALNKSQKKKITWNTKYFEVKLMKKMKMKIRGKFFGWDCTLTWLTEVGTDQHTPITSRSRRPSTVGNDKDYQHFQQERYNSITISRIGKFSHLQNKPINKQGNKILGQVQKSTSFLKLRFLFAATWLDGWPIFASRLLFLFVQCTCL